MKLNKYLYAWALLSIFVGCTKEDSELFTAIDATEDITFYAEIADSHSRTYVEDDKYLRWHAGDELSIFRGSAYNYQYRFNGEDGSNSGSFSKVVANADDFYTGNLLDANYAVYPYNGATTIDENGTITLSLPATQSYLENSFGKGANTMIAVTQNIDDHFLSFKNICGFLKLKLYGDNITVKSVMVTGNNGERIAGKATVTVPYAEKPTITMQASATTSVSVDCGDGILLSKSASEPTIFWIALPPTNFSKGITIKITDIEGKSFVKSTSNTVQITANTPQPMAALNVLPTYNTLYSFSFLQADNTSLIADVNMPIVENNLTLCTPLVFNRSNLIATFMTNGDTVTVDGVAQTSGQTANDFTQPVTYTITTGTKTTEYVVSLTNTGLPVVVVNTPNNATIPPKTEDWLADTEMKIYKADGSVNFDGVTNIRGRGNSTWTFPKKPYAIKLENKASILGMPKHKRWVLLANWMDRTMLRNHIAFEISKATGLDWTPRGEFVEVILNGKHVGNYYLCEQIKIDENRVNINEMEDTDIEGDAITGGYLMELDVNFDEVNKFKSAIKQLPYMFKEPDEDALNEQQKNYMMNYINTLEEMMYDDTKFAARDYADYLDIDSFIDWWFVHELAGNGEPNHPKSTYMHKDKLGKLKAGPVWDFDWGTFVGSSYYHTKSAVYYGRLFSDPTFVTRVKELWSLRKSGFDSIINTIATKASELENSAVLNIALWPLTNQTVNGDEQMSYEDAVNRMKSAYTNKLNWLDSRIQNME